MVVKFLFSILALVVGACVGLLFAVEFEQVKVSEVPVRDLIDLVAFIATVLGGASAFIATLLALYAFHQWKEQQRELDLRHLRKDILTKIYNVEFSFNNFINLSYIFEYDGKLNELSRDFGAARGELISSWTLYYIHSTHSLDDEVISKKSGDFLDTTKELNHFLQVLWSVMLTTGVERKPLSVIFSPDANAMFNEDSRYFKDLKERLAKNSEVSHDELKAMINKRVKAAFEDVAKQN